MKANKVQCEICDKICTSPDLGYAGITNALTHWQGTGHNSWTLLLPKQNDRQMSGICQPVANQNKVRQRLDF